ncbi:MAG: hypothetical protein K6T83_22790 [Alicyclobacillus sp.]|nr:hypothetical protein [Alicyclobacillus sp.]
MKVTCTETQIRLPWLVNGRLHSVETVETLEHVRVCSTCMQELALTHTLSRAAHSAWATVPEMRLRCVWGSVSIHLADPVAVPGQPPVSRPDSVISVLLTKLLTCAEPVVSVQRATSAVIRDLRTGLTSASHTVTRWLVMALQA